MKKQLLFPFFLLSMLSLKAQILCNPSGNVVLFSNYDGGVLNINVDVNIPNLKIGVVSYEPVTINVGGAFVNTISEIRFAGYTPSGNLHCNNSPVVTSILGAPAGTDTIIYTPNSPVSNPNGYNIIICNYSCDSSTNQGGCNTPDQIAAYFLQSFGGTLRSHFTQYGCWNGAYLVSTGGNCCIGALPPSLLPSCALQSSDSSFCEKQCINFTDLTTNTPTSWQWYFPGATPDTSSLQNPTNICYNAYGNYDVSLVACNTTGCDSVFYPGLIDVYQPAPVPLITWQNDTLYCSPAAYYAWYDAGNPTVILSNDSFLNVSGIISNYFVIISDSNGCQVSSAIFAVTALNDLMNEIASFTIIPNPASDFIRIDRHILSNVKPKSWKILDLPGKLIGSGFLIDLIQNNSVNLDCSSLPNGIYLIELTGDTDVLREKFIVQH